jgi:Protein of unknown function (DUF1566)
MGHLATARMRGWLVFGMLVVAADARAQSQLVVEGAVESTSGGFEFADETVQTTAAGPGVVPVVETGQTACWDGDGAPVACSGTGQDGDWRAGSRLPTVRFVDNGDGTVSDRLTRLVWLRDANCFGTLAWESALTQIASLGNGECLLGDGSVEGAWRLPNVRELLSLFDRSRSEPALAPGHPFLSVPASLEYFWTSTTWSTSSSTGWGVDAFYGFWNTFIKTEELHVWPVRGPR